VGIIDADTHIDETDDTWEYMQEADLQFKPATAYPSNPDPKLPPARYWVIDGKRQIRFIRSDKDSDTTVETRELLDVKARLKHMDELGTDTQVIYPTLFLMEATEKPELNSSPIQPMNPNKSKLFPGHTDKRRTIESTLATRNAGMPKIRPTRYVRMPYVSL
jgi:hypothetical protein